eukprot:gene4819-5066_t
MFKKPFSINQTHKVSGADRKKIRRALSKSLQLSNEEQLDQLLPAKAGELELAKLPSPSRLVIYLLDGLPVLLDTSGKSDFIPTAMGLWSCPQLLPQVQLKHPAVSQFLLGGDMDELLELALLQALTKLVKEDELPMISSTLWSQHIKPCAPPGAAPLDVKKSSHKKMDKFLQVYSKCGLLSTKEDKFSGNTVITGINRSHQLLEDYRPYKMSSGSSSSAGGAPGATRPAVAGTVPAVAAGVSGPVAPLVVEESRKMRFVRLRGFRGYTAQQQQQQQQSGDAWQEQLDTMGPDNKTLVLDAHLCDALYKGLIKKGELYPTHIAKAELREAFLKRLQPQTCISRGDHHLLRKGAMPTVQISGERRQGNKYVTRVVGVEAFLVDPTQLAAECQKKFACSTSVNALPGKTNSGQEVILQGNVIEKVPDYLMNHYGIPKKYFLVKK